MVLKPEKAEYISQGYKHFLSKNSQFLELFKTAKRFYSLIIEKSQTGYNSAFRESSVLSRQLINLGRKKKSLARNLIENKFLKKSVLSLLDQDKRYMIKHTKISYKTPGQSPAWFPHKCAGFCSN